MARDLICLLEGGGGEGAYPFNNFLIIYYISFGFVSLFHFRWAQIGVFARVFNYFTEGGGGRGLPPLSIF